MRQIMVTFDLEGADSDQYRDVYAALGELGFLVAAKGILLPTTTLMGQWFDDSLPLPSIRDAVFHLMVKAGARPSALLVVAFDGAAWWGTPVGPT